MDSKERFSERVGDYVAYRPSYPVDAIQYIIDTVGIDTTATIADIGSGTGISAKMFTDRGIKVIGVEPNAAMRHASEIGIASPLFTAVDGSDKAMPIADASIRMVMAAQAFHWFDRVAFYQESMRVLHSDGYICLIWNDRDMQDPLQQRYSTIIDAYNTDYYKIYHGNISDALLTQYFSPIVYIKKIFPYVQHLDEHGLLGRLSSSSYMPNHGEKNYDAMAAATKELFNDFQKDGMITFAYKTRVYLAKIK